MVNNKIEYNFENVNIISEVETFRLLLWNELLLQPNYSDKPGLWEYRGVWYTSTCNLYMAILGYELAEQFGITDVLGLIAILSGAPLLPTRGKFRGATKGTSIASKYISKALPMKSSVRLPMVTGYPKIVGGHGVKIALTKIVGKFVGRSIPIVGWGVMGYDIAKAFYDTQIVYNSIVDGKK